MKRYSHLRAVERRTLWGGVTTTYHDFHVNENELFEILNRCDRLELTVDWELVGIHRDTERLNALKRKYDAEAAMLESYVKVTRKRVELQGLLQLTREMRTAEEQTLLSYRPQTPMANVR